MSAVIEEANRLRSINNHAEALRILDELLLEHPEDAVAWSTAALALRSLNRRKEAAEYIRESLKLFPAWANAWTRLGMVLCEDGETQEGRSALLHALRLEPGDPFTLRSLAELARNEKNFEEEISYLLEIHSNGQADANDLNAIGIAAFNNKDFSTAIQFYNASFAVKHSRRPLYNLAVLYNHPEVSQDVDATDCLRQSLALDPDYQLAKNLLGRITQRLVPLASQASEVDNLLEEDEWFRFYLNPFEILGGIPPSENAEIDKKWVQSAKKRIKCELELEDGRLEPLGNVSLDKNRILECVDEMFDGERRGFHWTVFQTPHLLNFLTRGEINHFLFFGDNAPYHALDALASEGFREWLSEPFASQYNLVLGRALEREEFAVIEALFDGRRWVLPKHDEICFSSASRHVSRRLEPLQQLAASSVTELPSLASICSIIDGVPTADDATTKGALARLLNLLPDHFRAHQLEAIEIIRSMAVTAYNKHGDADLSKSVLEVSQRFNFKSARIKQHLDDDFEQIQKLINQERADEAKYTLKNERIGVTKDGVTSGKNFLKASAVGGVSWSIIAHNSTVPHTYTFCLRFRDSARGIVNIEWASTNLDKNEVVFKALVKASLIYIVPGLVDRVKRQLDGGQRVVIGRCALTRDGVSFETPGWFLTKQHLVPWCRVETNAQNGVLQVFDKSDRSISVSFALADTENAVVLQYLSK